MHDSKFLFPTENRVFESINKKQLCSNLNEFGDHGKNKVISVVSKILKGVYPTNVLSCHSFPITLAEKQ